MLGRLARFAGKAAALAAVALALPREARADRLTIKNPGRHPDYTFEAEPHLLLGLIDPPGVAHGTGYGVGFRGSVELVDNGFVSTINNTIAIGVGLDYAHYSLGSERCIEYDVANECLIMNDEFTVDNYWVPFTMQWNFWLSRSWSVFGEPGLALRLERSEGEAEDISLEPLQFYVGGRYHFSETAALTMRAGYPSFSVGVSFLF